MNKALKPLLTLFVILLFGALAFAKQKKETLLVLDMQNSLQLPKNFRSSVDFLPPSLMSKGLAELKIAGGGQFSILSFEKIKQQLQVKKLFVIDLRQESHGFLNSNSISWFGWRNAANANLSPETIEKNQTNLLAKLNEQQIVIVNHILNKSENGAVDQSQPIEYWVHQARSEKNYIVNLGSEYLRIYVQDYHAPSNEQVDAFLMEIKKHSKNEWIYFHCRGGSGRTTTFMMMYDMLYNAKILSFEAILARQIAIGGKDLTVLPKKNHFKYNSALKRLNFIKKFYRYTKDNHDNFETSWTQWLKNTSD